MVAWAFGNLSGVLAVLEFFALVVMGLLAFTSIFNGKDSQRRDSSDALADGLIKRLQQTVDQNAKDMQTMSLRIDSQQKEIHQLQGQNEAYLKIITLRDPATAKVFEEAPEIYAIARETHQYAQEQVVALKNLTKTMEDFINRLPPFMPAMSA